MRNIPEISWLLEKPGLHVWYVNGSIDKLRQLYVADNEIQDRRGSPRHDLHNRRWRVIQYGAFS